MSNYTPTTDDVEDAWCARYDGEHAWASGEGRRGYEAEFYRWMEQVKSEARAGALTGAGLLARTLPTREEIADAIRAATDDGANTTADYADAVLALLKGQDA